MYCIHAQLYTYTHRYDWLWQNPLLTHKGKYLKIHNSIIPSVISQEGLKAAGLQVAIN